MAQTITDQSGNTHNFIETSDLQSTTNTGLMKWRNGKPGNEPLPLAVASGGTGATTASSALTNLGAQSALNRTITLNIDSNTTNAQLQLTDTGGNLSGTSGITVDW